MGAKPSYLPWTPAESEDLLSRIFKERIYKPLHNRTTKECERHLEDILIFNLPRIRKAINVYQEHNPQSKYNKEGTQSILHNPVNDRDEELYYNVLSEMFKLGGKLLEEGIRDLVKLYYAERVAVQHISSAELENRGDSLAWDNNSSLHSVQGSPLSKRKVHHWEA